MTMIYVMITAIVFATLEPVSKLIADQVNPFAITFLRCIIGALVMTPFALIKIKKKKMKLDVKDVLMSCLLGVLLICVALVVLQIGVKKADSPALIAIIFSSNSVITIVLAVIFGKEKMTKSRVLAVLLCIVGVLVCSDFSKGSNLLSIICALASAFSMSVYTVLTKKYVKKHGGMVHTLFSFWGGSIVLFLCLLVAGVDVIPTFTVQNISVLVFLGVVVTGIGYWAYNIAIEKGGATMASLAYFIKPILTPFATLAINGIKPDVRVFVALGLILCASYLVSYRKVGES